MSEIYKKLNRRLASSKTPARSVNAIVNERIDASPVVDILLEFGPQLIIANEIEMVARCLRRPKKVFRKAVPWLLSLFHEYPQNGLESQLWAVGDSIFTINDKNFYPDVIELCRQGVKYTSSRQMLMGTLARAKTDAAYDVLIECLDDPTVFGHAIEGLGRLGRTEAIPILEALPVRKGYYEAKAKETALRRLRRRLDAPSKHG
ncbi:MAG: HEAT repeat domain-containing protein [Planctomycetaceae bacterium]